MADPIDFYFDFASPYGYFASTKIDALAARHGREVNWNVFLVGAAFQVTGQVPVNERAQIQKDYSLRDLERSARYYGVPFKLPADFPYPLFAACRAFYWLQDRDPALAKALSHGARRLRLALLHRGQGEVLGRRPHGHAGVVAGARGLSGGLSGAWTGPAFPLPPAAGRGHPGADVNDRESRRR
jgi:hypothetical protein